MKELHMATVQFRFRLIWLLAAMLATCFLSAVLWNWHAVVSLFVLSIAMPVMFAVGALRGRGGLRAFCIGAVLPTSWYLIWGGGLSVPSTFMANQVHREQLAWLSAAVAMTFVLGLFGGILGCAVWWFVESEW